jgi:hypothetical protein
MSSQNRARRAAKKRTRDRRRREVPNAIGRPADADRAAGPVFDPATGSRHDASAQPGSRTPDGAEGIRATQQRVVGALDRALSAVAALSPQHPAVFSAVASLQVLSLEAPDPGLDPALLVDGDIRNTLGLLYEGGWQPMDLVHVVRRKVSAPTGDAAVAVIGRHARAGGTFGRAPEEWLAQLTALQITERGPTGPWPEPSGRASFEAWTAVLGMLSLLRRLPVIEQLLPPPSRWGSGTLRPPSAGGTKGRTLNEKSSRMLVRIRALLTKAESTEFAAEAEALTAKAQALMAAHSIDEALLTEESGHGYDIRGRRIHVDNPYSLQKVQLLNQVALANRVRAVYHELAGSMTVFGLLNDVDQVEMLFTSLLIQATRAMAEAGTTPGSHPRSATFRRAFLTGYAVRIGERLIAAVQETTTSYGGVLVPVLDRQQDAVTEAYERMFPHVVHRKSSRYVDPHGWHAGTEAAESAVLLYGQVGSGG